MFLSECLLTRVVEVAVHGLDLAASLVLGVADDGLPGAAAVTGYCGSVGRAERGAGHRGLRHEAVGGLADRPEHLLLPGHVPGPGRADTTDGYVVRGPHRWLRNPMYGVVNLHGYGVALC
jgi:hypothetical protein